MRPYEAVLLDVDGTLVDSNDAHARAWVEVFAEHGVAVDLARVRPLIGMGGDRLIATIADVPRDSDTVDRIGHRRAEIFLERWLGEVTPLPGVRDLLLRLRAEHLRYVVASAAKAVELRPLLERGGIADLIELATTSSDVEESKPDPEIVEAALAQLGEDRARAVMLGDTPYDLAACRGAGVDAIAFTSGGWSREVLAGAVAVFQHPADLLAHWDAVFGAR